jgi:hypothetical protein
MVEKLECYPVKVEKRGAVPARTAYYLPGVLHASRT